MRVRGTKVDPETARLLIKEADRLGTTPQHLAETILRNALKRARLTPYQRAYALLFGIYPYRRWPWSAPTPILPPDPP